MHNLICLRKLSTFILKWWHEPKSVKFFVLMQFLYHFVCFVNMSQQRSSTKKFSYLPAIIFLHHITNSLKTGGSSISSIFELLSIFLIFLNVVAGIRLLVMLEPFWNMSFLNYLWAENTTVLNGRLIASSCANFWRMVMNQCFIFVHKHLWIPIASKIC